jgi:hypothetical protein
MIFLDVIGVRASSIVVRAFPRRTTTSDERGILAAG